MTLLRIGLVLALAVAATVVANVVLLGVATGSGGPGKLSPHSAVTSPAPAPPPASKSAPQPVRPVRGELERDD